VAIGSRDKIRDKQFSEKHNRHIMIKSHLPEINKNIGHGRFSYSENEKNTSSLDMPVFAYMRKSTTKPEQNDSLPQQEE